MPNLKFPCEIKILLPTFISIRDHCDNAYHGFVVLLSTVSVIAMIYDADNMLGHKNFPLKGYQGPHYSLFWHYCIDDTHSDYQ